MLSEYRQLHLIEISRFDAFHFLLAKLASTVWRDTTHLTKSRIEHVQSHLVTLLGSRDCNQTLVTVILRLIDFDNTSAQLPYLVDLRAPLANNSSNHIIRNENLLGERLSRDHTLDRLLRWSGMTLLSSTMLLRLMRASTCIIRCLWSTAIMYWLLLLLLWRLTMQVRYTVRIGRRLVSLVCVTAVVVWMTVLSASRLRNIWNNLHASGHNTSRSAAPSGICRSSRSAKSLRQLLDKGLAYVISGYMDSVSNAKNNERPLRRQWKCRI